jgi:hypothetical protein
VVPTSQNMQLREQVLKGNRSTPRERPILREGTGPKRYS